MNSVRNIVLVTGSNGRIGSAVVRRLSGRFSDVVGFDRKAPAPPRAARTVSRRTEAHTGLRVLETALTTTIDEVSHGCKNRALS